MSECLFKVSFQRGDLEGFKAVSNGCLVFYDSRALDSIANAEYRSYKDY